MGTRGPLPKSPDVRSRDNDRNITDRYYSIEPVEPRKMPTSPVGGWSRMARRLWRSITAEGWTTLLSEHDWLLAETWLQTADRHHRLLADPKASAASIATLAAESRRALEAFGGTAASRARRHWWPIEQASAKDRARHLSSVSTAPAESYSYDELMARREAMGP